MKCVIREREFGKQQAKTNLGVPNVQVPVGLRGKAGDIFSPCCFQMSGELLGSVPECVAGNLVRIGEARNVCTKNVERSTYLA